MKAFEWFAHLTDAISGSLSPAMERVHFSGSVVAELLRQPRQAAITTIEVNMVQWKREPRSGPHTHDHSGELPLGREASAYHNSEPIDGRPFPQFQTTATAM